MERSQKQQPLGDQKLVSGNSIVRTSNQENVTKKFDLAKDRFSEEDNGFVIVNMDEVNGYLTSQTSLMTNNGTDRDSRERKLNSEVEERKGSDVATDTVSLDMSENSSSGGYLQLMTNDIEMDDHKQNAEESPLQQKLVWLETCVQCDKRAEDQRTLKCDHSFCIHCLSKRVDKNSIRCFNCKEVTELPAEGVSSLKPNIPVLMFRILIDKMRERNNNPQNLSCGLCKMADTVCYCRTCDKNMCESCSSKHGQRQQFLEHNVRPLSELKEGLLRKQVVKCEQHPSQDVEYMCTEHLQLLCSVCVHFAVCGSDHDEKISCIKKLLKGNRQDTHKKSIQIKQNVEALKNYYKSAIQSQEELQLAKKEIENHYQKVLDYQMKKINEKKKLLVAEVETIEETIQERQAELHSQWRKLERQVSQVDQWEEDMDDNMPDLFSAITVNHLQYRYQSVEVHMASVQRVFNGLKPLKVNFEPKEGEQVGSVKVEEDPGDCILPEPIEPQVEWKSNSLYISADEMPPGPPESFSENLRNQSAKTKMEKNPLYVPFENKAKASPMEKIHKQVLVKKPSPPMRRARDSIAGLVHPYFEERPAVDMSARPLHKPIKLLDPKRTSGAVFVDIDRLAVADSANNTINIYKVTGKSHITSRKFEEAKGLTALTMHENHLLAVDNNLTIFIINPDKLTFEKKFFPEVDDNSKVGDITTLHDGRIIISQIAPNSQLLSFNSQFELLDCWNLMATDVPRYITSDDQDRVIVVETEHEVVTVYDVQDGLVSKREIIELRKPRGLCNIDGITYIVHHDPISGSDWVLKLDNYVAMAWSKEKIKKYGRALTVTASEDYFVILAEKAIEVFSLTDMVIEDEAASLK